MATQSDLMQHPDEPVHPQPQMHVNNAQDAKKNLEDADLKKIPHPIRKILSICLNELEKTNIPCTIALASSVNGIAFSFISPGSEK